MDLTEEVEEDVCRVCRLEADEENPMVHPCRCSGSVRWVHPDCLKSWLATSQKKHCEICGHRYTFTKVYPEHLPAIIPPEVYGRQTVMYVQKIVSYAARCVLVGMIWLVVLPNVNMSVLRSSGVFSNMVVSHFTPSIPPSTPPPPAETYKFTIPLPPFPSLSLLTSLLSLLTSLAHAITVPFAVSYRVALNGTRIALGLIRYGLRMVSAAVGGVVGLVVPGLKARKDRAIVAGHGHEAVGDRDGVEGLGRDAVQRLVEGSGDVWRWLGREWDEWVEGEMDFMPSPENIFRAQILSLVLIGLIIALIFIREWYATFNWPTDKPKTPEAVADPDEWIICNGIPRRIFERGVVYPLDDPQSGAYTDAESARLSPPGASDTKGKGKATVYGQPVLRLRTDIKGASYRRALAKQAIEHGYDVLPGGVVRPAIVSRTSSPIGPTSASNTGSASSSGSGETMADKDSCSKAIRGTIYDTSISNGHSLPRSTKHRKGDRATKVRDEPASGDPSADPHRRRSEGDTWGVLVRFPSEPVHVNGANSSAAKLLGAGGIGEPMARSTSSPPDQKKSPTDLYIADEQEGDRETRASGRSEAVAGAGSSSGASASGSGSSTGPTSKTAPKPRSLAQLKPPKLKRSFSELQKSPRDALSRAVSDDAPIPSSSGKEEGGSGNERGEAGPGPSTIAQQAVRSSDTGPEPKSAAQASETPTDAITTNAAPGTDISLAGVLTTSTETSTTSNGPSQVTPLFSTPASSIPGPSATTNTAPPPSHPTTPAPTPRRAPGLLLGMSKGKGKARAAEPEVAKESESGMLVRAHSISTGSPTSVKGSLRWKSPTVATASASAEGQGKAGGDVVLDDEGEGEEVGWARRRTVSSGASMGRSSFGRSAGRAIAKEAGREVGAGGNDSVNASPSPKSATAPTATQTRPLNGSSDSIPRSDAGSSGKGIDERKEAITTSSGPFEEEKRHAVGLPARRPMPSQWHPDPIPDEDQMVPATHTASELPARTVGTQPDSDEHTEINKAAAQPEKVAAASATTSAKDQPDKNSTTSPRKDPAPSISGRQAAGSAAATNTETPAFDLAKTIILDDNHSSEAFADFKAGAAVIRAKMDATTRKSKVIDPDTVPVNDLWRVIDAADAALYGTPTPPAPGAAPNAAGARVMRAQLGGVGVEVQFEQLPRNPGRRAGVPGPPAVLAEQQDVENAAIDAVARDAADGDWEDVPDELLDEEDDGAWAAEDWDQIWELLGFEGPISTLFQNFILAVAVMTAALMVFVLMPMTTGRVVFSLDSVQAGGTAPKGAGMLMTFIWGILVDAVRPFVYLASWLLRNTVWPLVSPVLKLPDVIGLRAPREWLFKEVEGLLLFNRISSAVAIASKSDPGSWKITNVSGMGSTARVYNALTSGEIIANLDKIDHPAAKYAMNALAVLGKKSHEVYQHFRLGCVAIARSHSLRDSVICLCLGYATIALGVIVARILTQTGAVKTGPAVRETLKRWSMFIKLAVFIMIELIVFPLSIGAYINIAAMPIFPGMTFASRVADVKDGSFGAVFVLWMIGTMFMYGFAQVISWIRSICRVGTLYFIRDPHDPNYSAVKDMIERPTMSQLRKMGSSTMMYGTVVWMLFGTTTWTLYYATNILPLKLTGFGPLSSIPFDYLFLLIVVPPTIDSIRPRHTMKRLLMQYWRLSTKLFRLRSLLIGRRYTMQRHSTHVSRIEHLVWSIIDVPLQLFFGCYDSAESLMRVPFADSVVLLTSNGKRQPMFIPLDENRQPKTREAKIRMLRQDQLARRAKREPTMDFMVVRLPQHWRTRVHMFIFSTLAASALFVALVVVLPILLGRRISAAWVGEVHDGYSYIAGSYAMYVGIYLGIKFRSFIRAITHAEHFHYYNPAAGARIKRTVVRFYQAAYAIITLFCVHPIARGLVWEMRLGMLVRHGLTEGRNVLHLWDMWSIGAVLNMLEMGLCELLPNHRINAERDHALHELRQFPLKATPWGITVYGWVAISLLIIKSALSYGVTEAVVYGLDVQSDERKTMIFRLSGLVVWAITETIEKRKQIGAYLMTLRQDMIDAEYVVEERVENYEPPKEHKPKKSGKKRGKKARGQGRQIAADVAAAAAAQNPDMQAGEVVALERNVRRILDGVEERAGVAGERGEGEVRAVDGARESEGDTTDSDTGADDAGPERQGAPVNDLLRERTNEPESSDDGTDDGEGEPNGGEGAPGLAAVQMPAAADGLGENDDDDWEDESSGSEPEAAERDA